MRKFKYTKAKLLLFALLAPFSFLLAQKQITGNVSDSSGTPVAGVSVFEKGTTKGTSTDAKGDFALSVKENATLVFSHVSFAVKEVKVGSENFLKVQLGSLAQAAVPEVVVVGYGVQKKATLTGAVTQVKGTELSKSPVASVTNALVGRLPGLRAVQSSGEPGNDVSNIDIRGFGTALTIVDGVPMDFAQLDPAEIESVSILKDASAAVYGIKAANGVVLVTTKRGTNSKAKISLNTYYGLEKPTRYPKFLNAGEFAELTDEALVNNGQDPLYGADEVAKWKNQTDAAHKSTDWYKLAVKNLTAQQYNNLSVAGGTDATRYFISLGYLNQNGIWTSNATNFKRYNLRSNISTKIANNLTAEINIGARLEDKRYPQAGPSVLMNEIQRSFPTSPAYANNNKQYYARTNIDKNVLASMDNNFSGSYRDKYRFISVAGSLTYDVPWVKGLSAKAFYSYTSGNDNGKAFYQQYYLYSYDAATSIYDPSYASDVSRLSTSLYQEDNSLLNVSLNYTAKFGNHNLKALALFEKRNKIYSGEGIGGNFELDAIHQVDLLPGNTATVYGTGNSEPYLGYIGRINYDYENKYLVEFAGRYDGSWKFPPYHRWGFFPSVSAGWVISRESFFKSNVINNFKLRGSWGILGDDADFGGNEYLASYNYPSGTYLFSDGSVTPGLSPSVIPNKTLTWFVSHTSDIGVDLGFFKNMLTLEMDVFYRNRTHLFGTRALQVPGTVGADLPQENINSDNNRGFEIAVGYNKRMRNFSLSVSPNFTFTRRKYGHYEQAPPTSAFDNYWNNIENRWANISWGYRAIGQFKSMEEIATAPIQDKENNHTLLPGDIRYADLNKDGKIDDKDRTVIGRGSTPEIYYGLNLSANYKDFDLSLLMQGATHFSIAFDNEMQQPFFNNANTYEFFTDRWHRSNLYDKTTGWVAGKYPSTRYNGTTSNNLPSDFWLKNVSYLRLKTIEIGYTMPKKLLAKTRAINQARFYISGQNLLTFDNLKFIDPEAPSKNANEGNGKYYPQLKIMTVGVNVQF